MPVPDSVADLVRRYTENRAQYRQSHYNETQTRVDFVNPFFAALGWDMDNAEGLPEAYRQVVHEDALKIERTVKAPDYSFRAAGQRKFFLETKKPSVHISLLREPAYQLRRYAWTANLPVSLLCSFDEMAVYDGRIVPAKDDSPRKALLDTYKYTEYLDKWDEIYARFSREAVDSGAFDRYAEEEIPLFRGRQRVDAAFLQTIEGWRGSLAQALTSQNPSLTPRDLNRAVQTIIDRILFLRICEARGVEAEYKLQPAANGANVYGRLLEIFHHADERYNSGLFHFKPEPGRGDYDALTPRLSVDDTVLKRIIGSLYYPESPFEFSVMPADILGQVYEQFLGKVIRVDSGTASVEEKPEVRKAGGVFYTPTYIVDYIVRQTVGRLVEGKTPKQVAGMTVLDPACGSGSFLIGAYQFLLDWHAQWYVTDGPDKWAKGKNAALYQGPNNTWRLTTPERKRILRGCIYGVDIDAQAVEVTKLSLLLKMLEGESAQVVDSNLRLFKERALPDLDANIKCGNSLIGSDFYADQDPSLFDMETRLRINTFDWDVEFAPIMDKGGFSAVIGNPPYSNYSSRDSMRAFYEKNKMLFELQVLTESIEYCTRKYAQVSAGCKDLYKWFIYVGLRLLKDKGELGFIVSNTWLTLPKYLDLKQLVLSPGNSSYVVDLGFGVFAVTVPTCVLLTAKNDSPGGVFYSDLKTVANKEEALKGDLDWHTALNDTKANVVVEKYLDAWPKQHRLKSALILREGQHIPRQWLKEGHDDHALPITDSKNMGRYTYKVQPQFCYASASSIVNFTPTSGERIIIRKTGDAIVASLTPEKQSYVLQSLYQGIDIHGDVSKKYLLGLLNSRFLTFIYQNSPFGQKGRTMAQFRKGSLDTLPIPVIDLNTPIDKQQHDQLVSLVEQMLSLHRQLPTQTDPQIRTQTTRQIAATDKRIDALVYALYGLTPQEIDLVEGRAAPTP